MFRDNMWFSGPLWELSARGSQIIVETTESMVGAISELGRPMGEGNAGSSSQ